MADEFKFTENSARSVVTTALEGIKTSQRITEAKAAGATPSEVAKAAFGSDEAINELGKAVCMLALFRDLGALYDLTDPINVLPGGPRENQVFVGYAACLQHFVDSEPAKRFSDFFDAAQTCGDALTYFLQENGLEDDVIRNHADYDHAFFQEWKAMSLRPQFALNRAAYDRLIEHADREYAETEERLKREGKL